MLSIPDETFVEPDARSLDEPATAVCYGDTIQGRLAFDEGSSQRLARRRSDPEPPPTGQAREPSPDGRASAQRRLQWVLEAELLRHVFDVDGLDCPICRERMRVIAPIIKADVIAAILESLGTGSEPPTVRPTRAPPDHDLVEIDWS